MSNELKQLVEQYKRERTYRDGGRAAKRTLAAIKNVATLKEYAAILEGFLEQNEPSDIW